ncbi:CASP-like protein 4D1 [Vitis riparia]|uniref:CASP-like protein 4D1 n=1 Tax=Vitis riparia TaxID=96939 RepID=UPI00155AD4DD|nr:CASP-like protein 4D1 [Vitis riparia]XP_034704241.1 CASP-like protein 4D1 [Vitis riparia]
MKPPSPVAALVLRILTLISISISFIVLITNTTTLSSDYGKVKLHFKDVYSYRYMVFTLVVGFAYTLLQIAFTIYQVCMGKRLSSGDGLYQFDFYGDKVVSYVLATGVGAAFGATIDLKEASSGANKFFNKGSAAASLLLLAFLFTAVSSVFSSLALPKKI